MMNNNITELRDVLFEALRDLKSGKIKKEDAKAISEVAQTIINSAKVEVDYSRHTGRRTTGFLEELNKEKPASYVHRIGG